MASFANIPNELKDAIVAQISFDEKLNLSKTCRSIRAAVYPALLHTISMTYLLTTFRIDMLLRTLLEDVSLAPYIKSLTLCT